VGDRHILHEPIAHQLAPGDRGAELISQRAAGDAALLEEIVERAFRHVVLLLDAAKGLLEFLGRHGDVEALGLLHLQLLVDQAAQDLRLEARAVLRRILDAGGAHDQLHAVGEVVERDDFVVDDGGDAGLLRDGAAGEEKDQAKCENQPHGRDKTIRTPKETGRCRRGLPPYTAARPSVARPPRARPGQNVASVLPISPRFLKTMVKTREVPGLTSPLVMPDWVSEVMKAMHSSR